jgi:hypothetical protein
MPVGVGGGLCNGSEAINIYCNNNWLMHLDPPNQWKTYTNVQPGSRYFKLILICGGACPANVYSNGAVRNLAFAMEDGDAPAISFAGGTLSYVDGYANPTSWNSGAKTLVVRGWDGSSGTERDLVAFDHDVNHPLKQVQQAPGCNRVTGGYSTFVPCAALNDFTHKIDTTQFADGGHALHAWNYDASGNSAQVNLTFRVDNTKPAEPATLDVMGDNEHGWQSTNDFDLTWTNTGESVETNTASGIAAIHVNVEPTEAGQPDPAAVTVPVGGVAGGIDASMGSIDGVSVPADGEWSVVVRTVDKAGNVSDAAQASLMLDTTVPGKPGGQANGWVGLPELLNGKFQYWTKPDNHAQIESDFCGYGLSVTQAPLDEAPTTINVVGNVEEGQIPPGTPEGNNWVHFRAISCAGIAGPSEHVSLNVDLTNPHATVTGIPSSGWTNRPGLVNVTGTDKMPGSGMDGAPGHLSAIEGASVRFELNEVAAEEVRGAHSASFDLSGLQEGVHTLTIDTFDWARNYDEQTYAYGVDKTAPGGAFIGADPADPTVFKVAATDALSGVVGGRIEYAPLSDADTPSAYKPLATAIDNGQLSAAFPDTKLPHGRYALRAMVEDAATNQGLVTKNVAGVRMVIENPLREPVGLTFLATKNAKVCTRKRARSKRGKKRAAKRLRACRKKRKARRGTDVSVAARYGRALMLIGRLTDKHGRALAGEQVTLLQQRAGESLSSVGSATTGFDGRFSYKAPGGPSRRIVAYWAGTKTRQDVSASVRLRVATKVTLRVTPGNVRGTRPFTLKGKVFSQDGISPEGKLVQLQFYNYMRKKWQAGPALVRAGKAGVYRYTYRIKRSAAAREKIKFRAYVPAETSWAYDPGASPARTLVHTK